MSIATTVPQRSQGMSLLSITSLVSGGRGGRSTDPTSSRVLPITASIWRVNSSPNGLKIAARCVVIGSDGHQTHTPRHWKDAASRKIRLVVIESRSCFSLWKVNQKDHNLCAAAIVEQPRKKSSPGSTTFRSQRRQIYPSVTISPLAKRF